MKVSYKKLFKMLIDVDMKKTTLADQAGISRATLANMKNGRAVSGSTIQKICGVLHCDPDDIMELLPT